jgi:uncharacterized protein (TIGR00725 family)
MRKRVIGVMGGAAAGDEACLLAYRLGQLVAAGGDVLLCGGRPEGVMEQAARGAREQGGLTVGILPGSDPDQASVYIDLAVATGMGNARNAVNVLSSDAVVACAGGTGTISEVALALKSGKMVVALGFDPGSCFRPWVGRGLHLAGSAEEAYRLVQQHLGRGDTAR